MRGYLNSLPEGLGTLHELAGGLMSFDGAHPAPLAYALATNEIIQAINGTYEARIPLVTLTPFMFSPEGDLSPPPPPPTLPELAAAESFESVRNGLGLPSREELLRLIGERQQAGTSTGPRSGRRPRNRSFR